MDAYAVDLNTLFGADENIPFAVYHPGFYEIASFRVDTDRHIGGANLELPRVHDIPRTELGIGAKSGIIIFIKMRDAGFCHAAGLQNIFDSGF